MTNGDYIIKRLFEEAEAESDAELRETKKAAAFAVTILIRMLTIDRHESEFGKSDCTAEPDAECIVPSAQI